MTIFRFPGLHNNLHAAGVFPEFYAALSASADFIQILDGDERISLVHGRKWYADHKIVDFLRDQNPNYFVLGCWLPNIPQSSTKFLFAPRSQVLTRLLWGKSVFPTKQSWPLPHRLHNCQHDIDKIQFNKSSGWFVLHLKNLNFQHRLFGIRQKLAARHAIRGDETDEEILRGIPLPSAVIEPSVPFYFNEFRKIHIFLQTGVFPTPIPEEDIIEFRENGAVFFRSEKSKVIFCEYQENSLRMFLESYENLQKNI